MVIDQKNIFDLNETSINFDEVFDLCIIGGGIIGIYVTIEMLKKGFKILLIDAGPLNPLFSEELGFESEFLSNVYNGATFGRQFGLGGTSEKWGGLLIPHNEYDLSDNDYISSWKFIIETINEFENQVFKNLSLKKSYLNLSTQNKDFMDQNLVFSKSFELKKGIRLNSYFRNFKRILNNEIKNKNLKILINAVAKKWDIKTNSSNRFVKNLICESFKKKQSKIKSKEFLISSGALESCRILLEIEEECKSKIFPKQNRPGNSLCDHISLPIGKIINDEKNLLLKYLSPNFLNSSLVTYRFVNKSNQPNYRKGFFHFIFNSKDSVYELIKDVQNSIQQNKFKSLNLKLIPSALYNIPSLTINRIINKKVYFPPDTEKILKYDISLNKRDNRFLNLSNNKDVFGRKKILLNWKIDQDDISINNKEINYFIEKWNFKGSKMPIIEPLSINYSDKLLNEKSYDAYHPTGTSVIGENTLFPISEDFTVSTFRNLYSISTGLLPSSGTANPTFTVLCLAQRFCNQFRLIERV